MKVWNSDKYYKKAKEGSVDVKHFGMKQLKELSKTASTILDMGCGEGTRLGFIGKGKKGYGVDISKKAISLAKNKIINGADERIYDSPKTYGIK